MKRKRAPPKVAEIELVYDRNGSIDGRVRVVDPAEKRRREQARKDRLTAKYLKGTGTEWLIAKYKRNRKVATCDVLKVLAAFKRLYQGERDAAGLQIDVTLPFDLIDVIGSAIGPQAWEHAQAQWASDEAEKKKTAGAERRAQWQERADEIRRNNPGIKMKKDVANKIWQTLPGDESKRPTPAWIARKIVIPQK